MLNSKYSRGYSSKEVMLEGIKEIEQLRSDNKQIYTKLIDILSNKEVLLAAYTNIKSKEGAMTPGTDLMTLDKINLEWFEEAKKGLRTGSYKFKPARIVEIPKPNGGTRRLGIPSPRDKIIQEGIRMILEAIFDKNFSQNSHGFRKGKSCHTALNVIKRDFGPWFIEGDICFDSFDHNLIIKMLEEKIKDQQFMDIIYKSLKAGYLEQGVHKMNNKGTPQGSVVSPMLSNIYLDKLDKYMEEYKENFDKGIRKRQNPQYTKVLNNKNMSIKEKNMFLHKIPSYSPIDENFKRLAYVRYADDFLIGIIGSKKDCEKIREDIKIFLDKELKLILNLDKTKITNAKKERAKFLGFEIHITPHNKKPLVKVKRMNKGKEKTIIVATRPLLSAPISNIIDKFKEIGYCSEKYEPTRVGRLIHYTDIYIINHYSSIWRGIANYYSIASNFWSLNRVYYILIYSCLLTLVSKNKLKTKKKGVKVYGMPMKIKVEENKYISFPPFEKPSRKSEINYDVLQYIENISKRTQRTIESFNKPCSICGSNENIQMHHKIH